MSLFGVCYTIKPEKMGDVVDMFAKGKVTFPKGMKVIEEYLWGTNTFEILEAEDMDTVMTYLVQFMPSCNDISVHAISTLRSVLKKFGIKPPY